MLAPIRVVCLAITCPLLLSNCTLLRAPARLIQTVVGAAGRVLHVDAKTGQKEWRVGSEEIEQSRHAIDTLPLRPAPPTEVRLVAR